MTIQEVSSDEGKLHYHLIEQFEVACYVSTLNFWHKLKLIRLRAVAFSIPPTIEQANRGDVACCRLVQISNWKNE
jgi:hypothetical protein